MKESEKVFQKLPAKSKIPDISKSIVATIFNKKGSIFKSTQYFVLYPDSIYYFNSKKDTNPKGYTLLDFKLRYEIIRENDSKSEQGKQKLGKIKGIKFDKDGCSCELFSQSEKDILIWRDHLRGKINCRGFHELFIAQRKIGKGNFASVYLAERLEDEKMFAVKAFSKEAAFSQDKGKEALLTEIDLMRELDNNYIMKLHEVFETENSLYFILDLLEGGQLHNKIKIKYKFTTEETRLIMKGLCEGIAYMHQKEIMHRDLKPENILFRKENDVSSVVIADLGLGTRTNLEEYLFVRCGTPGFVAPEVVNIKDLKTTYNCVCDVYSLGLIFHILLIGKTPFNGKTYNEVLAQNRAGTVKLDGPEYLRVSNDAFDLLQKMLEKEPTNRIKSSDVMKHPYITSKEKVKEQEEKKDQDDISTDKQSYVIDQSEEDVVNEDGKIEQTNILNKNVIQIKKNPNLNLSPSKLNNSPQNSPFFKNGGVGLRKLSQNQLEADSCVAFKMAASPLFTGNTDKVKQGNNGSILMIETPMMNARKFSQSPQKSKGKGEFVKTGKEYEVLGKLGRMENLQAIQEGDEFQKGQKEEKPKQVSKNQVKNIMGGLKKEI